MTQPKWGQESRPSPPLGRRTHPARGTAPLGVVSAAEPTAASGEAASPVTKLVKRCMGARNMTISVWMREEVRAERAEGCPC